jgi:peptidyl-tRNA hydrolase
MAKDTEIRFITGDGLELGHGEIDPEKLAQALVDAVEARDILDYLEDSFVKNAQKKIYWSVNGVKTLNTKQMEFNDKELVKFRELIGKKGAGDVPPDQF